MKRRLFTLFAKFMLRRAPLARIDFPRQGTSYLVLDEATMFEREGSCVVQFAALRDIELGDEIVLRMGQGQAMRYRVRGQVTKEHRTMLTHARMLTLVTPRYAILATPA